MQIKEIMLSDPGIAFILLFILLPSLVSPKNVRLTTVIQDQNVKNGEVQCDKENCP